MQNAKSLAKPINKPTKHQAKSHVQRLKEHLEIPKSKATYYLQAYKGFGEFVSHQIEWVGST